MIEVARVEFVTESPPEIKIVLVASATTGESNPRQMNENHRALCCSLVKTDPPPTTQLVFIVLIIAVKVYVKSPNPLNKGILFVLRITALFRRTALLVKSKAKT